MAPTGPRSRPSQTPSSRSPPNATVRNEVFENIFGRPAGGHHLGPNVGAPVPPAGSVGYGAYSAPITYLNPAQPDYPQAQAQPSFPRAQASFSQVQPSFSQAPSSFSQAQPSFPPSHPPTHVPAPTRGPSQPYGQQLYLHQSQAETAYALGGGHENGTYDRGVSRGHSGALSQPEPPNRRASLVPSTYSNSSVPNYPPKNDSIFVPAAVSGRLPSLVQSATHRFEDPRLAGRIPAPIGLSAAQAYQASLEYSTPSPISVVFPRRSSVSSSPVGSTSSVTDSSSSQRSPPVLPTAKPTSCDSTQSDRIISPPPDYIKTMGSIGLDGAEDERLDNIRGLPNRGESSLMGSRLRGESADPQGHTSSQTAAFRTAEIHHESKTSTSRHQRMVSDSSLAGSGYTVGRNHMIRLSQSDQSPVAGDSPYDSPSKRASLEAAFAIHAPSRNSMELAHTVLGPADQDSLPPGAAPSAAFDARATSFSGSSTARKDYVATTRSESVGHGIRRGPPSSFSMPTPFASQRSLAATLNRSLSSAKIAPIPALPNIYPALLSRVADAFKQCIILSELIKDGLAYKDSFDGRTAVTMIAEIIKTPDRNLALLLGRALDAQKLFHDVTYDHRLRDNPGEVYQFRERLTAPFIPENNVTDSPMSEHGLSRGSSIRSGRRLGLPKMTLASDSGSIQTSDSQTSFFSNATPGASTTDLYPPTGMPQLANNLVSATSAPLAFDDDSEEDLPVGVFTLLTDCYSPTCTREQLCYSINCPRRLEQMKRLNMKPQPGLSRKLSNESLHDVKETGTLWIHSVSREILDSVDDTEKKRQEAINEVIYTERDFVRDLEYLRDSWVKPLISQDIVAADRKEDFVRQVFWNVHDVLSVNLPLAERLTKRQKQQAVVSAIGDIFIHRVPHFEPYVAYGAHQLFGKYEFEKEKGANPAFQRFVDETERKPESRKLELNGYLTKPTTRLGRYPLLLEAVLKYTPDDHPDKQDLPEVIKMIRGYLTKVNVESGKSENIFELAQLEQQLVFRPNETIDLRLRDKNRELVHKGPLKRRGGNRDEIADLMGFLFDHAFLLVKPKWVNKAEQYRVYRRPIPLELLVIVTPDDHYNSTRLSGGRNKLAVRTSASASKGSVTHVPPKPDSKHGFSITIVHLGKKGYSMQLWVDTYVSRKKWLEGIDKQQITLRDRSCVFVTETITEGYFAGLRRVNCLSPYDNGHRMIYGTDDGVYFSNLRDDKLREPVKVINLLDVTQVDVIEEFQLLIVLHERSVTTFPLDCLDPNDPSAAIKRGKRISSHTSFFKSGTCLGKTLVAVVKSSTLSSTIKVLEPIDQTIRGKKPQTSFMKRLNGGNEALKLFKEFYIPTESSSVHFLKTKLCVGCTKGFEIVDLETLDMQGLLDPSDASLDFVLKRDNVRPIAIYRIEEDFLLCYDEFAFYVNKNGWRSRPKWAIIWEGMPTAFALQYPYVIAFELTFVEVHHVETGHLVQIIPGSIISCLFADTPPSRVNAPLPAPTRQLMYPPGPPSAFRPHPQHHPSFPQYASHQPSYGPPGQMLPPRPYPMAPPAAPLSPRYARPQVIFTSDDGHIQFLKLPPPRPPAMHSHRASR